MTHCQNWTKKKEPDMTMLNESLIHRMQSAWLYTHSYISLFILQKSSGDLFGSDPFAPSPPAKTRSESPRPALPPKQKKAPPPRPAPPKGKSPVSSPSKPKKPDPFGAGAFPNDPFGNSDPFSGSSTTGVSGHGGGDAFSSNFADFSPSKVSGL